MKRLAHICNVLQHTLTTLREDLQMGIEDQTFSFFPFGALFCLTLFCIVAVRIYAIRCRYMHSKQIDRLKDLVIDGELSEAEYQKLKSLLTK